MDGCDISREALAIAERLAVEGDYADRLHYFACDLDTDTLEVDKYDLCCSAAALHHVADLDHALAQIRRSLYPDGLLVQMEYVEPTRFQWSDKVQLIMNRILEILPESYRMSIPLPGVVKGPLTRPSVEAVAAADPSEAVRSGEILSRLQQSFEILYRADFGGTLLQFVLADIAGNFKADNSKDRAILELMILLEETLICEQVIPSDFVMVVARPL